MNNISFSSNNVSFCNENNCLNIKGSLAKTITLGIALVVVFSSVASLLDSTD